jgi:hypothetical protein
MNVFGRIYLGIGTLLLLALITIGLAYKDLLQHHIVMWWLPGAASLCFAGAAGNICGFSYRFWSCERLALMMTALPIFFAIKATMCTDPACRGNRIRTVLILFFTLAPWVPYYVYKYRRNALRNRLSSDVHPPVPAEAPVNSILEHGEKVEAMHGATDCITIPSSRVKIAFLTLGAFLFVAVCVLLFVVADTRGPFDSIVLKGVSVLGICFFGLCGFFGLVRLCDGSPGLVLDYEGIIEHSGGIGAVGRVAWQEILGIQSISVSGQKWLAVFVNEPEKYLSEGNILKRLFRRMNHRIYGTPILISASSLKVKYEDLDEQIRDFLESRGVKSL